MIYHGIELPDSIIVKNVGEMVWKGIPDDPVVDDEVELTTHAQAAKRQAAIFEERGIYSHKRWFLRYALRDAQKAAIKEPRAAWMKVRERDWDNRHNCPEWEEYQRIRAPYVNAKAQNRREWYAYKKLYKAEMKELDAVLERLWHKEQAEEQARKEAEAKRKAEKARRKAEAEAARRAKWTPEYRKQMEEHEARTRAKNRQAQQERERDHEKFMEQFIRKTDQELYDYAIAEIDGPNGIPNLTPRRKRNYALQLVEQYKAGIAAWKAKRGK